MGSNGKKLTLIKEITSAIYLHNLSKKLCITI